jgi:hypothetical protein
MKISIYALKFKTFLKVLKNDVCAETSFFVFLEYFYKNNVSAQTLVFAFFTKNQKNVDFIALLTCLTKSVKNRCLPLFWQTFQKRRFHLLSQ